MSLGGYSLAVAQVKIHGEDDLVTRPARQALSHVVEHKAHQGFAKADARQQPIAQSLPDP